MADTNNATEDSLMPENLSMRPRTIGEPVSASSEDTNHKSRADVSGGASSENHTVGTGAQDSNGPCVAKLTSNKEPPQMLEPSNKGWNQSDDVESFLQAITVKPEPDEEMEEEVKIKEEFEEVDVKEEPSNQDTTDSPIVGKLQIKPMASLVETAPPNPQPSLHPFFAGFDDHIRSLIINRQPQFTMNPALLQQPGRFMYYDNSTNMNLKKMLNGHKMAQQPAPVHQYRPYVPINVPRPPRSQPRSFRNSFSTQTPPVLMGPNVPGEPSTSYQWLPQSRPPVPNFPTKIDTHNFPVENTISRPTSNDQMKMNLPQANIQFSHNSTSFNHSSASNLAPPNNSMNSVTPQSKKVSTSSSTDDLENHSSENAVTFKTEIDLGIDTKEKLHATLGAHFMDSSESAMPTLENVNPFEMAPAEPQCPIPTTTEPQPPVLTGDVVTPTKEPAKRNPACELPTYSTKGWLLCKCCDFRCNRRKKMKEHFDTMHTAENRFKCFYCVKNSAGIVYHKTIHDLEHHVAKVHRGEKRWQCKVCSKTYKCRASLKIHREKCSVSHPYACHMCTFTCRTEASLEKHIKAHEKSQETELCPFCNKTFKRFYIKTHLITVHAPPEEKPYHCMTCDYAAGTQSSLESHYRRTGHDKKFKCNHCEYACRSHSILKDHINTVHGDPSKPVDPDRMTCGVDGCKVKCLSGRSLKAHRKLHLIPDSELFTCPDQDCLRKFQTKRLLQLHVIKTAHHKPFKCTDCSLRFLKEESVNHHIQSVHVSNILKKMERVAKQEPVCVKNVVDVYNWVGGAGSLETSSGSLGDISNFGCWLGISGFGDIKTDCDNEPSLMAVTGEQIDDVEAIKCEPIESEEAFKEEKNEKEEPDQATNMEEDDDYENLVPVTCLVEVKQEDNELNIGNNSNEEILVKKEEDEDDSNYQHINPELSNLIECQQNPTADPPSDDENPEVDCLPINLVKVGLEEGNAS